MMWIPYQKDAKPLLCPSLLAADFAHLHEELQKVASMDALHLDVMDGHFVPNISFGPGLIRSLRKISTTFFDVHLMVSDPERWLEPMREAGADSFVFHPEACPHSHRLLTEIRKQGMKAGIALNPGTSLSTVEELLPFLDLLLVMTVNPGFGGQAYIPEMEGKMKAAREKLDRVNPACHLEVDGGIQSETFDRARAAGANMFVMGSACFHHENPSAFLDSLRNRP